MMKKSNQWLIYVVALIFMGVGVSCHSRDPNRSVSSSDPGEKAGVGITQGLGGRITAPSGRPISGALIQPRSLDNHGPPIPEIAILTDDDGWYMWPLLPGMYEISVSAEGYQPVTQQVTVKAGRVVNVNLTLERAR